MSATALSDENDWLRPFAERIPKVEKASEAAKPENREATYQVLLRIEAEGFLGSAHPGGGASIPLTRPGSPPSPTASTTKPRLADFMKAYQLSLDDFARVVDLETGHVVTRSLGGTKSEGTRRLGALLALAQAAKTGEFRVPRSDHVKQCEDNGVYDSANYSATMKDTVHDGVAVFVLDGKDWKVTRPGEGYIALVVKSALQANLAGSA